MIRINLLPADVQSAPTRINPAVPIAVATLLPALFLVPFHFAKLSERKKLQSDISALRNELTRYEPIIAQVETLEKAKMELTQKKGIIQQLENERLRYPQFFDDFVKLIPNNIWLTNLATTMSPNSPQLAVNMDVMALDNYAIADLISNLESSQIFTDIDLGAISANQTPGGGQTMTFRVTANYKRAENTPNAPQKS